jgi:two-component system cell cycle sensor histidine kinase/response regulator CckA
MSCEEPMSATEQSALCLGLAEALGVGDASRCLSDVLSVLERHAIVQCGPLDAGPSVLRIERQGCVLNLMARGRMPDAATRELLGNLIRTAWLRTLEHEERERDLREAQRLEHERRELELHVQRGQRLESLGTLAGGIAHDFNNLLVGVLGNAELLSCRLSDPEDLDCCEAIRIAAERAASLTKQLLAYAGKSQPGARGPIDIAVLGREARALLDATLAKHAHLELRLEPDCVVVGERAPITEVLVHLLTNAGDALADKPGVITVSARRLQVPGPEWQHALGAMTAPGEWVLLQVKDTGIGMDDATAARIFEPFFSTKAKSHGLGLAACLGIVASHGGAIRVESALGAGTCISILLPALSAAGRKPRAEHRTGEPLSCKVLVIDDEPLVLSNVRRSLEQRGFRVFDACDGPNALACYRDVAADLIIIDLTMPGINGVEVVRRMRAAGLLTPIILSSGNLDNEVLRSLPRGAIQGTLPKPYGPKALLEAIERALEAVDAGQPSPLK